MGENDRLQIQNSVSLSIALTAVAVALLAGIVAAFFTVAEKIPSGWYGWAVVGVVVLASVCLTSSIFFGGQGVSATNKTIAKNPSPLPSKYDDGNFNKQAVAGLLGLILGVIVFVPFGIGVIGRSSAGGKETPPIIIQQPADPRVESLASGFQQLQTEALQLKKEITSLREEQKQLNEKLEKASQDLAPLKKALGEKKAEKDREKARK